MSCLLSVGLKFQIFNQISNLESNLIPKSWIVKLQISDQISNRETTKRQ